MKFRIFNRLIKIDINTCQPEPHWKRQVINRVWDEYKTGRIHCWHVNAIDNKVSVKMFNNGNLLYAFSENKLTAETGLMRELSKGDVVFLYVSNFRECISKNRDATNRQLLLLCRENS